MSASKEDLEANEVFWREFNEYNERCKKEPLNPKHLWEFSRFLMNSFEYNSACACLKLLLRLTPDDLVSLAMLDHCAKQICDWDYYKDIWPREWVLNRLREMCRAHDTNIDAPGRIYLKIRS